MYTKTYVLKADLYVLVSIDVVVCGGVSHMNKNTL